MKEAFLHLDIFSNSLDNLSEVAPTANYHSYQWFPPLCTGWGVWCATSHHGGSANKRWLAHGRHHIASKYQERPNSSPFASLSLVSSLLLLRRWKKVGEFTRGGLLRDFLCVVAHTRTAGKCLLARFKVCGGICFSASFMWSNANVTLCRGTTVVF